MSLSPEDRERIVEAITDALFGYREKPGEGELWGRDATQARAAAALDAALSAGLAEAIRRKALEDKK